MEKENQGPVAIIGLGYVGLPLAVAFAKAGCFVLGIDTDERKIGALREGRSYVEDVSAQEIRDISDRFRPTNDYSAAVGAKSIVIAVPTPLRKSKDPDISHILASLEALGPHVRKGMLIVLESTTYPGTTTEVVKPFLEARGLVIGRDVALAFSPERIDPGNKRFGIRNTPKIVGGATKWCTERAKALYEMVAENVVPVSSPTAAEFSKLLENTFRAVNIGLVNELAILCRRMGIDPFEVIDAAATKPFGFMPFYPGPGIGGHCIPIDPMYLSWKARFHDYRTRFIELADDINSNMPRHVVQRASEALNQQGRALKGAKVLVLGVSYKRNIGDYRESPIMQVMEYLEAAGCEVVYHDPFVPAIHLNGLRKQTVALDDALLSGADLVLLGTDHDQFDRARIVARARCILDTRNFFKGTDSENLHRL